ncbi:MAG: hypothetical protein JO250_09960 [Armatimonadetes bacterium]|nr:hypothetical protein [Armatimonadota bacterium]
MNKAITGLTACVLALGVLGTSAFGAAPAKKAGKMVAMYQAEKCHMYFTAAQYKQYHGACPVSHGKMHKAMLASNKVKAAMAATDKELTEAKKK